MTPAAGVPQWHGLDLGWVYSDLLASISRKTRCAHRARDVLHDSLLRFVLARDGDVIRQPHAYLRTVVGSVLSDHQRDASRYLPLDDPRRPEAVQACAPSAECLADIRQRLKAVQRILDCLPPRCREVFWLFRIEGRTQPQIAAQLGISLNMVERHVMRALVDLRNARELLGEC